MDFITLHYYFVHDVVTYDCYSRQYENCCDAEQTTVYDDEIRIRFSYTHENEYYANPENFIERNTELKSITIKISDITHIKNYKFNFKTDTCMNSTIIYKEGSAVFLNNGDSIGLAETPDEIMSLIGKDKSFIKLNNDRFGSVIVNADNITMVKSSNDSCSYSTIGFSGFKDNCLSVTESLDEIMELINNSKRTVSGNPNLLQRY